MVNHIENASGSLRLPPRMQLKRVSEPSKLELLEEGEMKTRQGERDAGGERDRERESSNQFLSLPHVDTVPNAFARLPQTSSIALLLPSLFTFLFQTKLQLRHQFN